MGTVVKLRQGKHIELSFCAVLPFKELGKNSPTKMILKIK